MTDTGNTTHSQGSICAVGARVWHTLFDIIAWWLGCWQQLSSVAAFRHRDMGIHTSVGM
jgi:hypothetical protein